jgi:hypothetical protein
MEALMSSGIAAAFVLAASLLFGQSKVNPTQNLPTTLGPSPTADPAPTQPGKSCQTAADAAQPTNTNQDLCVQAHVYDVVELADGTRFLDVCPPEVKDDQCRFTLLSLAADRQEIGDLRKYRDQDVVVRGIVRSTHGRMGIVISHLRQFHGGPEKFRPNPRLVRGFDAESSRRPIRDPNLVGSGHHRGFMNSRDEGTLPAPQKH